MNKTSTSGELLDYPSSMARSPHDPIYTVGWITFITIIGIFILAYQTKPIPPVLGAILGWFANSLTQAIRSYIGEREDNKGE